jgi:hypothetical protein
MADPAAALTARKTACCELYHSTLDVCMVNKVRKYHSMCETVDSVYVAVDTQQRIFC